MLRLNADSKLHIIKQKHGKRSEPRNVKMNEKNFCSRTRQWIVENWMQSTRNETTRWSKERAKNQLTALPCIIFCVIVGEHSEREKKESDFCGEILSFCTNSTHCSCCISPEVVTPILEALSLRYHLSFGHFRYQRVSYIRGRSVGLLYQRFESPFFYQRDSSSSFRRKSFLLHLDLYLFPHWFQIWIASHVNLNKDEFYGQSL